MSREVRSFKDRLLAFFIQEIEQPRYNDNDAPPTRIRQPIQGVALKPTQEENVNWEDVRATRQKLTRQKSILLKTPLEEAIR